MKRRMLLVPFVMAILCLLSACNHEPKTVEVPMVRLCDAEVSAVGETVTYPGKTYASASSNVAFRVSGTLQSVAVGVGDHVRQGQVLARMDSRDYQVQLEATQAEYESVRGECERIMALYADNGTSQNNYDKARYGLQQITQKLRHAQDQVADCELRAPYDGYVQTVLHEAHETVAAGMPVVSLFASSGVEMVINIPAAEFQRSSEFHAFTAQFAALPDQEFSLRLLGIAQKANANQLYEMRLLLDDASRQVTPGMTAMVSVHYDTSNLPSLIKVPAVAVFEHAGQSNVFVYDEADSCVHRTPVVLSRVMSDGNAMLHLVLRPGQRVVASGVHHLSDGQAVRPWPAPSDTNVGGLL